MSEEDLVLLITLDDPGNPPREDTFHHLQANNLGYWLGQQFPAGCRLDQRTEAVGVDNGSMVTFGQGDWTCTLSKLTGAANYSTADMNVEVCTITHWKNGQIVEQKLFYDLAGMQKQVGIM
jgi:hypothetical protein